VVSFPFDGGFEEEEPSMFVLALDFQRPLIALAALLVTLIVAFRVTRTLKTPESSKKELKGKARGAKLNVVVGGAGAAGLDSGEAEAMLPPPGPSNRELVAAHIDAHPDVAVKMIRSWMKED
jgi:flagellar biosynthesis/type III secretory pathway M-ring protein FliF/YscJ